MFESSSFHSLMTYGKKFFFEMPSSTKKYIESIWEPVRISHLWK